MFNSLSFQIYPRLRVSLQIQGNMFQWYVNQPHSTDLKDLKCTSWAYVLQKIFQFIQLKPNLENKLLMTPPSYFHFLSYFTLFVPKSLHYLYNKSEESTTCIDFHVFILNFPWMSPQYPQTKKIKIFLFLFPSNVSNFYRTQETF